MHERGLGNHGDIVNRFLPGALILFLAGPIWISWWSPPARAETSFGVNRIRHVAATGTSEENCQSLKNVLSSISDNSSTNQYLLQLEPGIYYCSTSVVVGEGIALAGSGKDHTEIRGAVDNNLLGVVHIAGGGVVLRNLSITNLVTFPSQQSIALSINTFLSSDSLFGIELRDLGLTGLTRSISAQDAEIEVWSSELVGPVVHDSSGGSLYDASFRYTLLPSVQGTGSHSCWFCVDPVTATEFDAACQPTT